MSLIQSRPIGFMSDLSLVKMMTFAWAPLRPASMPVLFVVVRDELDADREALRIPDPALTALCTVASWPVGAFIALADAPADAVHLAVEELAGLNVERDRHILARLHIAQLVLPHVGGNPPRTASRKLRSGWPGATYWPAARRRLVTVPSAGATTSRVARSSRA